MKKMLMVFLSVVFLVSALFMVSCQKKETAKTEETMTETAGEETMTETAGEETMTETAGYGEKAAEEAGH